MPWPAEQLGRGEKVRATAGGTEAPGRPRERASCWGGTRVLPEGDGE